MFCKTLQMYILTTLQVSLYCLQECSYFRYSRFDWVFFHPSKPTAALLRYFFPLFHGFIVIYIHFLYSYSL